MTLYKNKNLLKLAIILSVFFGFFLGFNNGDTYAIENNVFNLNPSSEQTVHNLCSENCSSFQYLTIKVNSGSFRNTQYFTVNTGTLEYQIYPHRFNSFLIAVKTGYNNSFSLNNSSFSPLGNFSIDVILSDNIPLNVGSLNISNNGSFNVNGKAEVVVNVPQETVVEVVEDPISNDFQKVFFKIVENIIPAFGILLVVWFGIDMLSSLIFGRGR